MWTEAVNTAEKQIPTEEPPNLLKRSLLPPSLRKQNRLQRSLLKRTRLPQILHQRIHLRRTRPQNLNRNRIPSPKRAGTPAMVEQNNTILSKK